MKDLKKVKSLKTKVQDVNEAKGIVTIQITQFEKYDSDNDRLLKGALNKTWKDGRQVHLVDHKLGMSTFVGLPVSKDPTSGIIESKINLDKQIGKDLFADYKFSSENGRSLQHSHGFFAVKGKYQENEKGGFDFSEINQFEYSTVIYGAVSDTPLLGMKSLSLLTPEEIIKELDLRLSQGNYSDEYGLMLDNLVKKYKEPLNSTPQHSQTKEPSNNTLNYLIQNL